MNNLLKVENYEGLYRDPTTNVIINNNNRSYTEHIKRKQLMEQKQAESDATKKEIEQLKTDVQEIKNMLLALLEKR